MAQTIGSLVIELRANAEAFLRGMQQARQYTFDSVSGIVGSLGKIGESLGKLKFDDAHLAASLKSIGSITAGISVAIAAAGTAAVAAAVKSTADTAVQLGKLSQSYGISVESLSAFRVASRLTHVEMEALAVGFGRLARNAAQFAATGQAVTGAGNVVGGAFRSLNIQVLDSEGKLKQLEPLMLQIADRFAKMQDGTTKTALAMQLFGRSGAQLIPFLNLGSAGMQRMIELSNQLGLTWTEKDVAAAKQLHDQLVIQELKLTAIKENLAKGLIPALDQLASAFLRVDQGGGNLARTLGEGLGEALKATVKFVAAWVYEVEKIALKIEEIGLRIHKAQALSPGFEGGLAGGPALEALAPSETESKRVDDRLRQIERERTQIDLKWGNLINSLEEPPKTLNLPSGAAGKLDTSALAAALESARSQILSIQSQIAKDSGDTVGGIEKRYDALLEKVRSIFAKFPELAKEYGAQIAPQFLRDLPQLLRDLRIPEGITGKAAPFEVQIKIAEKKEIELQTARALEGTTAAIRKWQAEQKGVLPPLVAPPPITPALTPDRIATLSRIPEAGEERLKALASLGTETFKTTATVTEEYSTRLKDLFTALTTVDEQTHVGYINQETYNRAVLQLNESLAGAYNPLLGYEKELERINDVQAAGLLSTEQYAAAINRLGDQLASAQEQIALATGTFEGGAAAAFSRFSREAQDSAALAHRVFTEAFEGIGRSLTELIVTGRGHFADFAKQLEATITEGLIKKFVTGPITAKLGEVLFGDKYFGQKKGDAPGNPLYAYVTNLPAALGGRPGLPGVAGLPGAPGASGAGGAGATLTIPGVPPTGPSGVIGTLPLPPRVNPTFPQEAQRAEWQKTIAGVGSQFASMIKGVGGLFANLVSGIFGRLGSVGGKGGGTSEFIGALFREGDGGGAASPEEALSGVPFGGIFAKGGIFHSIGNSIQHFVAGGVVTGDTHKLWQHFAEGGTFSTQSIGDSIIQHFASGAIFSTENIAQHIQHFSEGGKFSSITHALAQHFADGGTINQRLAQGEVMRAPIAGIFSRSTLVEVGEGQHPEAVIPMPNRSTVPIAFTPSGIKIPLPGGRFIPAHIQHMERGGISFHGLPPRVFRYAAGGVFPDSATATSMMGPSPVSAPGLSAPSSAAGQQSGHSITINVAGGDPELNKRAVMRAIQESKSRAVYEAVLAVEERNLRR